MVAPRTISPTALRKVLAHDFRDALDDFTGAVPVQPDDYTLQAIDTLLGHLRACETYLVMLRHNARKIERCGAMRGMAPMSGGMDRWNDFCHAVTELEIHAVPYSVPNCRNKDWIRELLNTLNVAWVAFAQAEPCHGAPDDTSDTRTPHQSSADAAAAVLAQPSLRERLGRAPLGGEVLP